MSTFCRSSCFVITLGRTRIRRKITVLISQLFCFLLTPLKDMLWSEGDIAIHLTSLYGMTTGLQCIDYQKASRHVPIHAWEKAKYSSKQNEYKSYMGCFNSPVHPSRRRRVDIKFYPYRDRAFATLYFTGNGT